VDRSLWCAIAVALTVGAGCASAPKTRSFRDLPQHIDPGSTIRLIDTAGATTTGRLGTLTPTSLTILSDGVSREVAEERVASIRQPQRQIMYGVLFGLAGGVGVGIATASSGGSSGSPYVDAEAAGVSLLAGMALGTAVGAIIGAIVKVDRTIYEAPTGSDPARQQARRPHSGTERPGHGATPARPAPR
jgi:hypothetical protein